MQHELKCVLAPFQAKWDGIKDWEFRKNDRDYRKGDFLLEREYDPHTNTYSGREITEEILWILEGGQFGVPSDCVIMSTRIVRRIETQNALTFEYKNWKGEVGIRKVIPIEIFMGTTDFHKENQWLMIALDLEKNEERTFAMNDIIKFISNEKS